LEKQEILLEAGTNELEVVEFSIADNAYAVNALKIKQFIVYDEDQVNPIPDAEPAVLGSVLYQGEAVSVVDLKLFLNIPDTKKDQSDNGMNRQVLLFCEFNNQITSYIVDNVYKIQRISWEDIKPLGTNVNSNSNSKSVGVVVLDDRQITMLDFEKINAVLFSNDLEELNAKIADHTLEVEVKTDRSQIKILYAEDSQVYLKAIPEYFARNGYTNMSSFENGQRLFDHFQSLESSQLPDVIVTDIEMPQMDGLTLCKKIKGLHPTIKVVIVSSLISDQMAVKCKSVGADAHLVKKEVVKLIECLDEMLLASV